MTRLSVRRQVDAPVREASGLATVLLSGQEHLVVVGDAEPVIGWAALLGDDGRFAWSTASVADMAGAPKRLGQFEAVAGLADGRVLILSEDPPLLVAVDLAAGRVTDHWELTVAGDKKLRRMWDADPNSRGEGLVVLTGGNVLVIKEKSPVLAIEFGPAPAGQRPLPLSEHWQPPASGELPVAGWGPIAGAPGDLSDCAVRGGAMWVVSDQSRSLHTLTGPGPTSLTTGPGSRLDKAVTKPEGLAVTADGQVWLAMDLPTGRGALVSVDPPPHL